VDATSDDLTRPLGLEERPAPRALRLRGLARFAVAGLAVIAVGVSAVLILGGDPLGGEPHVVVPIETAPSAPPPAAQAGAKRDATTSGGAEVTVVRPDGASAPASLVITVPDAAGALRPAPDPRLVERGRYGLLPRIGPDGATPASVYARPADAAAAPGPRVAVLVGGLGIGQAATVDAIAKLPPR